MKVPDDKKQNRLATVKRGSGLAKKTNGLSACWPGLEELVMGFFQTRLRTKR